MSAVPAPVTKEDVYLKTTCYGCPSSTCGMIAHRVDGIVVDVRGDPDCPFSQGMLCAKGQSQIMMAYSKKRVTTCLKRTNPEKGIGVDPGWVEISYDEALTRCAEALKRCKETDPNGLVFGTSDFSTLYWFLGAMLVSFGSFNHTSGGRAFCGQNVHPTLQQVHGGFHVGPDWDHAKFVMLLGSNKGAMSNWAPVTAAFEMSRARKRGMKLVVVDPWCSNAAAVADEWVPIRPATDGAFVLAMLNVLLSDPKLHDIEFLRKLSNGPYLIRDSDDHYVRHPESNKPMLWDVSDNSAKVYDDPTLKDPALGGHFTVGGVACTPALELVRAHVAQYTPEWAAEITTVPAATIRRLAVEFGTAAAIGSTIEIDGVTLPLRPACAHWYKGVSQHQTSWEQGLLIGMLNTVIGAVDNPGGLAADAVYAHHPEFHPYSTWMGKDSGMRESDGLVAPGRIGTYADAFPGPFPTKDVVAPINHSADSLAAAGGFFGGILAKINICDPMKFNEKIPHATGVYVQAVSNDLLQEGNPKFQEDYLKKFAFHISIVPNIDETSEFANIIIPTQTQLERLDMGANNIPDTMGSTGTGEYCLNLRQPVVESPYKHVVDVWIDIAERIGILPEFNKMVNFFLEMQGEYALKPEQRYSNRELIDHWIHAMTGGKLSLEEVAKTGRIRWKKTVKERYPRMFFPGRIPLYYEYHIKTGEQVKALTERLGFKVKWDVSRYKPLIGWVPSIIHTDKTPGYELYGVSYKWPFLTGTFSNFNPWLAELANYHPYVGKIVLNRKYAESKGIKDGDRIRVENQRGRTVEGVALLSQCIHPECVGIDHASGNWAKSLPPRRKSQGVHYGKLLDYELKNMDVMDGAIETSPKLKLTRLS
jgi:molybdopterin-containing oxidoreductase family molybdopterin binding subunit